ncbi:hypothetical protein H1C71_021534 [Ictidomys tridecemlineatus]|nr:hypothetical protein H1C71_021534 [Ictidomys tridecemlineatus]
MEMVSGLFCRLSWRTLGVCLSRLCSVVLLPQGGLAAGQHTASRAGGPRCAEGSKLGAAPLKPAVGRTCYPLPQEPPAVVPRGKDFPALCKP